MTTIILTGLICFLVGILLTCAIKEISSDIPIIKPVHYPCCLDYPHKHYTDMEIKVMREHEYNRGKFETLNDGLVELDNKITNHLYDIERLIQD